ncbi:MAG: hypothetical protein NTZ25_00305 [Candidatus Peregrinibacteria bacterium]|nr:hypothetical protein [Candidatus Peregrinibacteria bacterium]
MKNSKKIILFSFLLLIIQIFAACGNPKADYKSIAESTTKQHEALDTWAKTTLDSGTFDQKVEVITEYTKQELFKSELAAKLSAQLRDQEQVEFKNGNIEKAYEMAKKIFGGMPLPENISILAEVAKSYSKITFDKKDYLKSVEASGQILQLYWNEDAMSMKLAAEYELLKANVSQNNLKDAKPYYDDILSVTALKGNENLAKKYRADTEKFSDKFPKDTKPENVPTATIAK